MLESPKNALSTLREDKRMNTNNFSNEEHDFKLNLDEEINFTLNMVKEMKKEEVMNYAQGFIFLQLKSEYLGKNLSNSERLCIDKYFKTFTKEHNGIPQKSFLQEIEYLNAMVKRLASIVEVDQNTMKKLAHDDPETYAKTLSYRRKHTPISASLGSYTNNLLSEYLKPDKDFYTEHEQWFMICESGKLSDSIPQTSLLSQLTTSDHCDK